MALLEFWRDITSGSPNDTVDRYRLDTADDSITHDTFSTLHGTLGVIHPPAGTVINASCVGPDRVVYTGVGSSVSLTKTVTANSPICCTLSISDFSIVKNNNTSLTIPDGRIIVTAPVLDIADYEASIDAGTTWESAIAGEIKFEGLSAGSYSVVIKEIVGVCSVTGGAVVSDQISYPPLIVSEETKPALYSPVFYPIELTYSLDNNEATVKQDITGVYLEVVSDDAKDYLKSKPLIKIFDDVYGGKYQIASLDDPDTPTKFYLDPEPTYTVDRVVIFVPFERQVFYLYAETTFNVYTRLAQIAVYPDESGIYKLRLEGFLQGIFQVNQPINSGQEITLLRKYYVIPRDFDLSEPQTVFNAVYSAVPDLTDFLDELVPLGPAPINFINEQTLKGLPVLFSYIETSTGRVVNITSSQETDVVSSDELVYIPGLPLNQYDVSWINPAGVIAGPINVVPALPAWIQTLASASDQIKLHIDLTQSFGGDYDPDDYNLIDYLTGGANAIVGCYEYEFLDDVTPLFTLRICVFPIIKSNDECVDTDSAFNIAWINQEGGWSSYVFTGNNKIGKDIGQVNTFKQGDVLKRSNLEDVYDSAEVGIYNRSVTDLIFISSLRQSIQAFLYSDATQQWSIPIIIDGKSFPIYSRPFKQIEVNEKLTFRYATEIRIQKQ